MSTNETGANKGTDGEAQRGEINDAGDYVPRNVDVHDVDKRLTQAVVDVDGRMTFLTEFEARELYDALGDVLEEGER